ncbi:helix-turn-helix domain-containing protein [Bacillus sp. UNCCL81]|uniref:helix-turn-helix transcriptional regulator n=1 Tax=Bacillus sp. UNCCL81 TaxID=1502755 RepID=UPI0008ECBDB3|nr:helix-turn-helix domain-containing protein [Bacillus sp. UNCCL81]SFC51856.1 DNA-binding transcriptional regulator, XRE-family HTH domain [Bacillus sp. UNCCL81]
MKNNLRVILAERRIKKGLFADQVGINRNTLSFIVNEKSVPTLEVALKIAKALDMKVEDIWSLEE